MGRRVLLFVIGSLMYAISVEAQAKSGHDIMDFSAWEPVQHADSLEPVDDVMREVLARNGPADPVVDYLAKHNGYHAVYGPPTRAGAKKR